MADDNIEIVFSHDGVNNSPHPYIPGAKRGPLTITTGANQITWGYGLNHTTYPTYGGEVVQILSAYTDDLVIEGEVRTVREMENIYGWFLTYMQTATQGAGGVPGYNQEPIDFKYSRRGWQQSIMVKGLPRFRYGRDVVIPQYRIEAAIIEGDETLNDVIKEFAHIKHLEADDGGFDLDAFHTVTGGIGYVENDPFSNPFPDADESEYDDKTTRLYQKLADWFNNIVEQYASGDYSGLKAGNGSYPALLEGGTGDNPNTTNQADPAKQKDLNPPKASAGDTETTGNVSK
jgi:hypothetical protein